MKQSFEGSSRSIARRYRGTSVSMGVLFGAVLLFSVIFVLDSSRITSALTTVPTKMNFQGRLTDASGNIKPNGTYNMKLSLYTVNSGGSAVWSEDRLVSATQGVQVANGLFSIKLGDITPLPASLFASGELYLEVELPTPATATSASPVWTEGPMTPRNQMATSAYAYNSETLDGLDSADFGQVAASNTWTGTNTIAVQSTGAFQVQNGSATDIFKVDTVSQKVTVGMNTSTARLGVEGPGGTIWTARSGSHAADWNGITYGNGLYVAVSATAVDQVMTSPDGITWTSRTAPAGGWVSVTYANGLFVAVGYYGTDRVMTSPDGITWTARTASEANGWWSVTYGNGLFVAVSTDGTNRVMTSPDGITWTARTAAEANAWQTVTYGNGLFVAVSTDGTNRVMTSPDGITWTARSTGAADGTWRSVAYGGGLFAAVANGGTNEIMTSPDGITWTARTSPVNGGWNSWYEVTYGNGRFVAIANGGEDQAMTSSDGVNWIAGSVPAPNSWQAITYGNGQFVAVSYDGTNRVMTSTDVALSTRGSVEVVGGITSNGSFGVKDITGTVSILTVDTSASTVRIGPATADANAVLLILDSKNTAGDPVGVNGASYYNSNSGKFRCYENGAWKDCDTGGTLASGTTAQRTGSPTEGAQFFDTTTKQLLVYANGKWQADRSTTTKIVAASNSSQAAKDAADYVATGAADQTQINAAVTAAAGGTVYLVEGTYYLSAQISMPNNTTLRGAGAGTLITLPNAQNGTYTMIANSDTSTGTGVTIRDLQIDANRANQTAGSMNAISFSGMGAGSGSSARLGSKILNTVIKNVRQGRGIILNGSNNTISNNTFQYNEIQGINMNGSYNLIADNRFLGNQNYTINVAGSNHSITGNVIEGGGAYGIMLTATYSTISGNTITTSASSAIYFTGIHATITGNNLNTNTGPGVEVRAEYATVTGNTVSGNSDNGIQVHSNYANVSSNNVNNNTQNGILVYSDSNSISDNRIHNNGSDGLRLFGPSDNNSIIGNYITDTAGSSDAINLDAFGGAPTGNYLTNNYFSGTGASSINDEGSGTFYSNQKDGSGNTINRTQGGAFTIGSTTASASLTVQGGVMTGQLTAPTLSATVTNVGTAGTTTYRYQVTALDGTGETVGSAIQQTTTGNATLTTSNYNTITWTAVPGAYQYAIYKCSGAACTPLKKTTVAGGVTSFNDQSAGTPVGAAPVANTTGGATFAGSLQGSSATLSGGLTVAGATALNGTLTATGTVLFKNTANSTAALEIQNSSSVALLTADTTNMKVTVRSLDVTLNLTVNGHIISGGSTPTIAAGTGACTSPSNLTITGTDTAGLITLTTGTACDNLGSSEDMVTVTFNSAYGSAPFVTLTPAAEHPSFTSPYLPTYASSTTTYFKIHNANEVPANQTLYRWYYQVIQ